MAYEMLFITVPTMLRLYDPSSTDEYEVVSPTSLLETISPRPLQEILADGWEPVSGPERFTDEFGRETIRATFKRLVAGHPAGHPAETALERIITELGIEILPGKTYSYESLADSIIECTRRESTSGGVR